MKAASQTDAKNRTGRAAGKVEKNQPGIPKKGEPVLTQREADGATKDGLLSSYQTSKGRGAARPQGKPAMQDSPYKQPARKSAAAVPVYTAADLASLRAYLQTLKPDNLANSIFRDQSSAATSFPSAWIRQVQGSLEATVDRLLPAILSAAPSKALPALVPPLEGDDAFDWTRFGELCSILWKDFSEHMFSTQGMPRLTLGLLAEVADELRRLPAFLALEAERRAQVLADALFSVYVWNGVMSPLMNRVPATHKRLMNLLCVYIKAAYGTTSTTQGESGLKVIGLVQAPHAQRCASFRRALMPEVERLAGLRTVVVQDRQDEHSLNGLREHHIDLYFTETWLSRADDYPRQLRQGSYLLTDRNGLTRKCRSYQEWRDYVGPGSKGSLPEVVLHVAGHRMKNFLCHTYLYDIDNPFFVDESGRRVDPVPDLEASFILSRNDAGVVTVRYCCDDHAVAKAMLVTAEQQDAEATPLFPAGIAFSGEMLFHPNEEFESGPVEIKGRNFHMFG